MLEVLKTVSKPFAKKNTYICGFEQTPLSQVNRGKAQHQLHELLLFSYPSSFSRGDGAVLQTEPSFWFREWNRRKQNWAGRCLKGTSVTQNTSLRFFSPYSPCCSRFSQSETDHGYDKRTLCIPNWITGDPKLTFVHTAITYLEMNSTEPFLCHHLFQHQLDLSFISYLVNLERQIQNKKIKGQKLFTTWYVYYLHFSNSLEAWNNQVLSQLLNKLLLLSTWSLSWISQYTEVCRYSPQLTVSF